ncbi:MAG: hypothetical protein U1E65_23575 [Myxococcota bacterium]
MEESETVVGVQAYRPAPRPEVDPSWSLGALARGEAGALEAARLEALELARALAAQAVAFAPDADTREFDERLTTLSRTIWPAQPLEGFGLESSLGAVLVARIAMNWARPAPATLRSIPLDPEALLVSLRDLGVEARVATLLTEGYEGPPLGFAADPDGLEAGTLAGLAEGTLTRRERDLALAQVASAPRDASRLATTIEVLSRARAALPVLPPTTADLGPGYAPAVAALVLGRPERTLELLGYRPEHPALIALAELARAEWAFQRGEEVELDDDPALVLPPLEHVRDTILPPPPSLEEGEVHREDDDDVLEMVEERVATGSEAALVPVGARPGLDQVRPPTWAALDHGPVFDEEFLAQWKAARRAMASLAARRPRVLGLKLERGPRTMPSVAIPPEPRVLVELIDREGLASDEQASNNAATDRLDLGEYLRVKGSAMGSAEPVFAAVRSALRVVVAATAGHTPTEAAIESAGDLDWVIARARVLALGGYGDLEAAMAATGRIQGPIPPEVRFVEARRLRYGEKAPPPVSPAELRRLAHPLVVDLAQALARTVAGTLI